MQNNNDAFGGMPSKTVFVFGLVTGVAVTLILSSIGAGGINLTAQTDTKEKDSQPAAVRDNTQPTPSRDTGSGVGTVEPVSEDDHVMGDPDAPITWIEYSDFECPFCQRFHPTMEQMMEEYDGQVKWVYRHFPLSFHEPNATDAAVASECAAEQGGDKAFFAFSGEYFDRTRSNGGGLSGETVTDIAADIGLNTGTFETCLESGKYDDHVQEDLASGQAAGVKGTPGSIVIGPNGDAQLVSGAVPYSQVQAAVDSMLSDL